MRVVNERDIDQICHWVNKGAKLMIGADHAGRRKIKVVRGPFGLLTERYHCTEQDITLLRRKLVRVEGKSAT
jgi:hypothetical protein